MKVRIVLRDRRTGLYLRCEHEWVRNAYDALTFSNIIDAEAFCRSHDLGEDLQCIQQSGYFYRAPRYRAATAPAESAAQPTAA